MKDMNSKEENRVKSIKNNLRKRFSRIKDRISLAIHELAELVVITLFRSVADILHEASL